VEVVVYRAEIRGRAAVWKGPFLEMWGVPTPLFGSTYQMPWCDLWGLLTIRKLVITCKATELGLKLCLECFSY